MYRPQFHPPIFQQRSASSYIHIIGLRLGIRRLSEIDIYSAAGPLAWQRFKGNPTRALSPGHTYVPCCMQFPLNGQNRFCISKGARNVIWHASFSICIICRLSDLHIFFFSNFLI